ncbi:MAG: 50S ribosomal protein L24e [Candidatus Micrarchaeota archaeon]
MANCSFCEEPIQKGTGLVYAKKDGTILNFCSSKCKKNSLTLRREGRRQKWTEAARKFQARQASKKEQAAKEAKVTKRAEEQVEKKERAGAKLAVPPGLEAKKAEEAKPETQRPAAKGPEPKKEAPKKAEEKK